MIALLALTASAFAQPAHPYDDALAALKQRSETEKAAPATPDRRVWDYVIADKKAGTVTVMAVASVIKPTDPVEFFVCTTTSGKDYESLAVTPATPSDIKAAMEFVGLKPGLPVDFEKNRYWPRGQRVTLTFTIAGKPVRAEELVLDTNTKQPLPRNGLVFTGSYTRTDEAGKTTLAADVLDAKPIAPLYNDPAGVLDVPRQAAQSVVYGFQKPSPAWTATAGESVDLTFAAARNREAVTSTDILIEVRRDNAKTAYLINVNPRRDPNPDKMWKFVPPDSADDLPHLMAKIADRTQPDRDQGKRDLFTTVYAEDQVPVNELRRLYAVLQSVEGDGSLKLDAADAGELFHRAFFPKPEWRDRATRLGEPWELFLTRDASGKLTAKLERAVDNPDRADGQPKYVVESTAPADPTMFVKTVNDKASRWSKAIFVYPPADLTYGELMTWVRPVLATYPRVFVFPADGPGDAATTAPATRPASGPTLDAK